MKTELFKVTMVWKKDGKREMLGTRTKGFALSENTAGLIADALNIANCFMDYEAVVEKCDLSEPEPPSSAFGPLLMRST